MSCPDENLIVDFVQGFASAHERELIESHIDACSDCRHALVMLTGDTLVDDPASEAYETGEMVDHFRVMRLLGTGGMGAVYLARDTKLGRKVALKILRPALDSDLLLREAQATAKLNHPHIVTIHAVGEHPPYVALEYVEGQTLAQRIADRRPSVHESLRIALAVAEALVHAHGQGVVHRDLKPANVIVDLEGRVRVLDFGLAEIEREQGPRRLVGTPSHMAPEQWLGRPSTPATDVWALGVILYQLLSGRRPFDEKSLARLAEAVKKRDAPPLELPIAMACLARDPDKRPSAQQIVEALRDALYEDKREIPEHESPFRGLLSFHERHAAQFFGRDDAISACVERLRHQPILPLVGPCGAGKSSLLHAGIIPRLREQEPWVVLSVRPRWEALAAAFGKGELTERLSVELAALAEREGRPVLLAIDQLEEVFTQGDPDDRFLSAVCGAADDPDDPIRVVFTLRDDYLGRAAATPAARAALSKLFVLHDPDARALREILEKPLERIDYRYEDALVDDMIAAVANERASLPLLSFTAQALWERRNKEARLLERAAYQQMGGVAGALADHADGVLSSLSPSELAVARELLLRLVTPEGTRRVIARSKALEGLEAEEVLAHFTEARLVTVTSAPGAEPMLELAHESLIDRWSTLAAWLAASQEEVAFLAEIGQAAELWDRRGRQPEELWQGAPLGDALRKLARCSTNVPSLVRQFAQAAEEREGRRTRRRRRLTLGAIAGLAIVAVVLAALTLEAEQQRRHADAQRREADQRHAEALREGARAALEHGDVLEARAKLRSSLEVQDSSLARMLWWKLASEPRIWSRKLGAATFGVAWAPDGKSIAVACQDEAVYLFDAQTAQPRILRGHRDQAFAVAFSPDGRALASGSWDHEVRIWQGEKMVRVLRGHTAAVSSVRFSPDGRTIASAARDGTLRLWNAESGEPLRKLEGHSGALLDVAFASDGRLASASVDRTVRLWSPKGESLRVLDGHEGEVHRVLFSPDGRLVASAGRDGKVRLFDAASGALLRMLAGHGTAVFGLAFMPDGKSLASGGNDDEVRIWDVASGKLTRTLAASGIFGLAFDASGRRLASVADDGTVSAWDIEVRAPANEGSGHDGAVWGVSFSHDGATIASAGRDDTVRLWDAASGRERRVLRGHTSPVSAVSFTPDGRIASASEDGTVRLWDAESGETLRVLGGAEAGLTGVAVDPDGRMVAASGRDKLVRLWDAESGKPLATLRGHEAGVYSVCFSPDGTRLASASHDRTVRSWNVAARSEERVFRGFDDSAFGVSFSPDGRGLASGSFDRRLRIWALAEDEPSWSAEHPGRVHGIAFHPEGTRIATAGSDGIARIWTIGKHDALLLRGHADEVNGIAFSKDGKWVATASDDGTVRVWDARRGAPRWGRAVARANETEDVTARAEVDASTVVLGYRDGNLEVVASGSARAIAFERVPASAPRRIVLGPMGTLIVGYDNGTVSMWQLEDGKQLARARLHGPVVDVNLEERTLSAVSELGDSLRWNLDALYRDRCELLQEVWKRVPVTWESGTAVARAAPADHPCR